MLKTFLTPFSTQKQSSSAMIVTPHDINFMMGFIKEEELFSTSANASSDSLSTIIASAKTIHHVRIFPKIIAFFIII